MRDNGEMEFESDKSNCENMPPFEDFTEDELALLVKELLVIKHTLQV
jgi:hypothetical protein